PAPASTGLPAGGELAALAQVIGGEGDEVGRGSALLKNAAADVGASRAFDARVRNGERLRAAQFETDANRNRRRADGDEAVAKSQFLPFPSRPPAERSDSTQPGNRNCNGNNDCSMN